MVVDGRFSLLECWLGAACWGRFRFGLAGAVSVPEALCLAAWERRTGGPLLVTFFFYPVLRRPTPHSMFDFHIHFPTPSKVHGFFLKDKNRIHCGCPCAKFETDI